MVVVVVDATWIYDFTMIDDNTFTVHWGDATLETADIGFGQCVDLSFSRPRGRPKEYIATDTSHYYHEFFSHLLLLFF